MRFTNLIHFNNFTDLFISDELSRVGFPPIGRVRAARVLSRKKKKKREREGDYLTLN